MLKPIALLILKKNFNIIADDTLIYIINAHRMQTDLNESYYRLPLIEFFLKPLYKIKFRQ
jgi:hypothetical protein